MYGIHLKYTTNRVVDSAFGYITSKTAGKKLQRVLVYIAFNLVGSILPAAREGFNELY